MKLRITALTSVLLLTLLLYWPSLHGPFMFDDFPNLSALSSIAHVDSWRDLGIYLSQARSFPGRPLAMLSFLLQKSAWPGDPFAFHVVNLAIHLLCGVLVYLLAMRLLRAWKKDTSAEDPRPWLYATLASALWLINPIQIAGVTLVVQRMNLLMAFFLLLGLLSYTHGLLKEQASPRERGTWMALGLGFCMGLSFLSKENGILLPLYALILDYTVLRQYVERLPRSLAWWRRALIWPVVAFVFAFLIWLAFTQSGHAGIRDFTVGERLLTEPRVLLNYLAKIFLPHFGAYGLYHDGYAVSKGLLTPWTTLPSILVVIGLVVTALYRRKSWPLFSLAVLWYFGGQVVESSSVMLELYYEHRNYTPLIGIMLALALFLARMAPGGRRQLITALASLWLVACCLTTGLSTRMYASQDQMAYTWAQAQPHSIRAQNYWAQRLIKHGQVHKAQAVIDRISKLYPDNSMLAESRMYLECLEGTLTPQNMQHVDSILRKAPYDRGGFQNMGQLRELAFSGGCPNLNPQSWLRMTDMLLGNPAYAENGIAAGYLHYQRHKWAVSEGNLDMAIQELKATYKHDPDANIPRLEARYLVSADLYDQAIAALRGTDYSRLPLLRRLLVNDKAINAEMIEKIKAMENTPANLKDRPHPGPAPDSSSSVH